MLPIKDIIEGHLNELFDRFDKMSKERLEICFKCPIVKKTDLGPVCDSSKWINPKTGEVSKVEKLGYKRGCNCRLSAKTRLENNHCIINRW